MWLRNFGFSQTQVKEKCRYQSLLISGNLQLRSTEGTKKEEKKKKRKNHKEKGKTADTCLSI